MVLEYVDQHQKTFKKMVSPVFYKNNDLFIEKVFIATLGVSAKTGNEEWLQKEIKLKADLKNLNLDQIIVN